MSLVDLQHHAYLFLGDRGRLGELTREFVESCSKGTGSLKPEVLWQETESFQIVDSREVARQQSVKVLPGGKRFFVIIFETITLPAQQALLKVLEEPNVGNHFFLICDPNNCELLPTLKSRCQIVKGDTVTEGDEEKRAAARRFLAAQPQERLALTSEIERRELTMLIHAIGKLCRGKLKAKEDEWVRETAETLVSLDLSFIDSSMPPKLLAEHLSLVLPIWPK